MRWGVGKWPYEEALAEVGQSYDVLRYYRPCSLRWSQKVKTMRVCAESECFNPNWCPPPPARGISGAGSFVRAGRVLRYHERRGGG